MRASEAHARGAASLREFLDFLCASLPALPAAAQSREGPGHQDCSSDAEDPVGPDEAALRARVASWVPLLLDIGDVGGATEPAVLNAVWKAVLLVLRAGRELLPLDYDASVVVAAALRQLRLLAASTTDLLQASPDALVRHLRMARFFAKSVANLAALFPAAFSGATAALFAATTADLWACVARSLCS